MGVSPILEERVAFISGVDASGRVAANSFHDWDEDAGGETYGSVAGPLKWGYPAAGTGATVSYAFDPASNWSPAETGAFLASMHLWEAEANIHFVPAADSQAAQILISRHNDGKAETEMRGSGAAVGATQLAVLSHATIGIDTGKAGFGPIGAPFAVDGGVPWDTVLHELGHAIGLGHAGPYNGPTAYQPGSRIADTLDYTIMSYFRPPAPHVYDWGGADGFAGEPVTPMMVDIAAVQRLYGAPVGGPLGGGNVFGFNTNIQGDVAQFFDFSVNRSPVVTLYSAGAGNTLDLTGYATVSTVDLRDGEGHASSVGGLTNNLYIAEGTRIETLLLGAGNDRAYANDLHDVIMGGGGNDVLTGGRGNDHLYGASAMATPSDGADVINGDAGSDYIQGNGGNDVLTGGDGSDRIQGGTGNDTIYGDDPLVPYFTGNDIINGNTGNDRIFGNSGNDILRGGQGDDTIGGGDGDDILMGDFGNDLIAFGSGTDIVYGGPGADRFYLWELDGAVTPGQISTIMDYEDGVDHLQRAEIGLPASVLHLGVVNDEQTAIATVAARETDTLNVWVATVGDHALLLFRTGGAEIMAVRMLGVSDAAITSDDFVAGFA